MRCLGGHFQGQLIYDPAVVKTGLIGESKESNLDRLKSMNINDPDKVYNSDELASGQTVLFAASGITPRHTDGRRPLLPWWGTHPKPGHFQPVTDGTVCGHHPYVG
jgi:hypothetical protein